jgi:transcriptional/translational regulatory protein YebC/TACO1
MKTTLELPDELFAQAKAAAAKRKTTFRAVVEHALRREVGSPTGAESPSPYYRIGPGGIPLMNHTGTGNRVVTSAMVREMLEEE